MKSKKLIVCGMVAFLAGCSGPNTVARNVETAASINSLAGVPYAGVVGLAASAVDIFSKVGKPKVAPASPGIRNHIQNSPAMIKLPNKEGKVVTTWRPRKGKDGQMISAETAPKISMEYTEAFMDAVGRFVAGDFGDGDELKKSENLKAWEKGELVVAEYDNPNGAKIIIVSNENRPGEPMLPEEWAEKSKSLK